MAGQIIGVDSSMIAVAAPLVAVAAVGAAVLIRARRPMTARSLVAHWPHTSGTVLSATVKVKGKGAARHETPLVLYAYQVGGEVYQGNRVRLHGVPDASGAVSRYPAGACVKVYYDPADPASSALER